MNRPIFKCLIYILIASLTALSTEIASFHQFDEITTFKWFCVFINVALQCLIALKAFLDQSISTEEAKTQQEVSIDID